MIISAHTSAMTTPVEKQPQSSILSMLSSGLECTNFAGIIFRKKRQRQRAKYIIGANSSETHLVSYIIAMLKRECITVWNGKG